MSIEIYRRKKKIKKHAAGDTLRTRIAGMQSESLLSGFTGNEIVINNVGQIRINDHATFFIFMLFRELILSRVRLCYLYYTEEDLTVGADEFAFPIEFLSLSARRVHRALLSFVHINSVVSSCIHILLLLLLFSQ